MGGRNLFPEEAQPEKKGRNLFATPAQPVSVMGSPITGLPPEELRRRRLLEQAQQAAAKQAAAERKTRVQAVEQKAGAAGDIASDKAREGSMSNPGAYALSGFAGFNAGRQAEEEVFKAENVIPADSALALRGSNSLAVGLPGILNETYRNSLAQAGEDQPVAAMAGDLIGYAAPGLAAWNTTRAGINAAARGLQLNVPFVNRAITTPNLIPQGGSAAARTTRYVAPRIGEGIGTAGHNAAYQAMINEPIRAAGAGEDLTLEGMGQAAKTGATDLLNLLPAGLSAANRTWNLATSGIAAPSRVAADMMNRFGVAPRQTAASQGIADASQSLAGQVQPEDIRGLTNIENALQFALRDNVNFPTARARNDRIAAGFERIREALPGNNDTTLNLARLIEREFAEDAPQTRDIIRRFLLKVGMDTPGGAQVVGSAANQMRGQQADILEQEAYSVFGGQPKVEAKTVLDQNLEMLGEETYTPILRQASTAPPEAQQRAAALIARRPEAEDILFNRADREGLTVQQYIDRNPLEALHWVQSDLARQARRLAGANNPDTALEGVVDNMKNVLRNNVPNYREADQLYASNIQAYGRLGTTRGPEAGTAGELKYDPGFGERLLGGGGSAPAGTRAEGRATAQTVYESMDDQSRRAAAISVRDVILDDLDKARAAGLQQRYETAAKFQRLQTEGALQALVDVFGEEGQRIVNRIRQFVDANEFAINIDPEFNSATMNKAQAMQTGAQPFAGPMGQATQSAAGSLGQNAVGDTFMMASGITSAPVLSAIKFVPWLADRLQPGHRTQRNIANTLLRGVERGANAPPIPPGPPPIAPLTPEQLPGRQNAFSQTMSNGQTVQPPQPAPTGNAFTRSQGLPSVTGDLQTGALYGGVGGFSGNFVDYNEDGVTDIQDMLIGAGVVGGSAMGLNRVGSEVVKRLPKKPPVEPPAKPAKPPMSDAKAREVYKARQEVERLTKRPSDADIAEKPWLDPSLDDVERSEMEILALAEEAGFGPQAKRLVDQIYAESDALVRQMGNADNEPSRYFALESRLREARTKLREGNFSDLRAIKGAKLQGLGNAFAEGAFGSVGGSALGSREDLNRDGVIDEQDMFLGAAGGAVGVPAVTALMRRGGNAFAPQSRTMGAGAPKTPQQAMRAELPGSPEYEAAVAKGLDMSQAGRMARAKDLGFNTEKVFYHGTHADIDRFNASGRGTFGEGVYLTGNPKLASGYATEEGGNVIPVYVKGKIATEADIDPGIPSYGGGSDKAYDAYAKGFSGYLHKYINGTEELVIFDPSNIRSVHAAFDPDKAASPILTAGLGGGGRKPPPDSPEAITEAVRGIARQTPATPPDAPLVAPRGNMRGVLQAPERIPPASPMAGQVPPPLPPRPISNRVPTSDMPNATEMGLMAGTGAAVGGAFLMEKANDPATFGLASFEELPADHPLRDPAYRQMALMAQMKQPPKAPPPIMPGGVLPPR